LIKTKTNIKEVELTQDEIILRHRINLLLRAKTIKNISAACRQSGVSRTVYYKYKNRYLTYGIEGLKDKIKATPVMPNATKKKTVEKVLTVAKKYPTYGPARLANELGNIVCSATVYNILRRHNLSKKLDRLLSLEEIPSSIKISPILVRKLESQKPAQIFSPRPGYMLSVDTFYVCTLKGVGRIYQFTAIDSNSSFGTAYLYADKSAASAVDFIARTIAIFKALAIAISSVLTDNGKEYTSHWKGPHIFEDYLSKRNIKHRYTKVRCPWTNGYAERFNRTLLEEFYQPALMRKNYSSIKELQADLDRYLYFYNFQRTHQGYRLKGKKPCEKLLTVSDLKALTG
jgi:transposase InsO family protein